MRIKSNIKNNTSVLVKGGFNITIPAGAVLELADEVYLQVEKDLAPLVKGKFLTILKGVAKSEEQIEQEEAEELAAAKALIAKMEAKSKSVAVATAPKTEGK